MRSLALAALALATLGALALGCKKDEPASNRPPPISEAERKRGDDACQAYLERLCACAAARPESKDLADRCEIKHAKPEAIKLALAVDDNPTATAREVAQAQDQVRKIIGKCIEENLALDQESCPP